MKCLCTALLARFTFIECVWKFGLSYLSAPSAGVTFMWRPHFLTWTRTLKRVWRAFPITLWKLVSPSRDALMDVNYSVWLCGCFDVTRPTKLPNQETFLGLFARSYGTCGFWSTLMDDGAFTAAFFPRGRNSPQPLVLGSCQLRTMCRSALVWWCHEAPASKQINAPLCIELRRRKVTKVWFGLNICNIRSLKLLHRFLDFYAVAFLPTT